MGRADALRAEPAGRVLRTRDVDEQGGRFVLAEAPDAAYLDFSEADGRLVLRYTEVDGALEGRGIGGALVRAALDHAGRAELTVVPRCGFVAGWLERHPERAEELNIATP